MHPMSIIDEQLRQELWHGKQFPVVVSMKNNEGHLQVPPFNDDGVLQLVQAIFESHSAQVAPHGLHLGVESVSR